MDRRRWLERTLRFAAACSLGPAALGLAEARARAPHAAGVPPGRAAAAAMGPALLDGRASDGRRLVLVELGGANDGLNTLVPWRDERYRALRPTLALGADELIGLDGLRIEPSAGARGGVGDAPALHGALAPLVPLLERGELAVVQGLGYPAPNRSHFSSVRLWETGGDGRAGPGPDGWATHDLEHRLGRPVADAHGIGLDGAAGPLESDTGRWLTTRSAASLGELAVPVPAAREHANAAVAAMAARVHRLDATLERLAGKVRAAPGVEPLEGGALGARLTEVLRLVVAGVDAPLYHVRLGGFDTHENQRGRHARLLEELATAVAALRDALVAAGEWERTLVLTYSEFGRRAAENGAGGTDHGTAAPHLLAGGALGTDRAVLGLAPDLGALDAEGDPAATLDYRALYDRTLAGWFGIDDNRFRAFRDPATAPLFARG